MTDEIGPFNAGPFYSEWISVNESLPLDDSEKYILFTDSTAVFYGRYYFSNSHENECLWKAEGTYFINNNITHWMPLPKPPEEDDKGKKIL